MRKINAVKKHLEKTVDLLPLDKNYHVNRLILEAKIKAVRYIIQSIDIDTKNLEPDRETTCSNYEWTTPYYDEY